MVYHGIPLYTMVYHGIPWYTMVYHCIPWYTMLYNGFFSRVGVFSSWKSHTEAAVKWK